MEQIYGRHNFHKHTFCVFTEAPKSAIDGLNPNYTSDSGSVYYFTEIGVYRLSNHWGRAAKCKWRLQASGDAYDKRIRLGYANWKDFHDDNSHQKLYFIEVDFMLKTAAYQHVNNFQSESKPFLRTASEASKTIKIIRNIFHSDGWAKYYSGEIDTLREKIISELVNTNKTLPKIKAGLL